MSHALASDRTLVLRRRLLLSAAATAAATRGCLLVYPPGKKARQRFGVGDTTGNFTVYACSKSAVSEDEAEGGASAVFSTARGKASNGASRRSNGGEDSRRPISCATLYTDQLFVMRGSVLDAYSRKGTAFFHVDTSVTESAHSLVIDTPYIFAAGEFILTTMKETTELGFFLSPDRIRAMTAFALPSSDGAVVSQMEERTVDEYVCCLGCNDRVLRLVQNNKLVKEIACEAALTALYWDAGQRRLYYGTQSGTLGAFRVVPTSSSASGGYELVRCMRYSPGKRTSSHGASATEVDAPPCGAVSCLTCYDMDCDGRVELLVGYEDGAVRVFAIVPAQEGEQETNGNNSGSSTNGSPPLPLAGKGAAAAAADADGDTRANSGAAKEQDSLVPLWGGSVEERVMGLAAGIVLSDAAHPDLLVHLFSGPVVCFSFVRAEVVRATAITPAVQLTSPTAGPFLSQPPSSPVAGGGGVVAAPDAVLTIRDAAARSEEESNGNEAAAGAGARERQERAARLQAEVEALRREIQGVTEELAKSTGAAQRQLPLVALAATFRAQVRLSVVEGSPLLALVMEADVPLAYAVLHSALPHLRVESTSSTLVVTMEDASRIAPAEHGGNTSEENGTLVLLQPLAADASEHGEGGAGGSPLGQTNAMTSGNTHDDTSSGGGAVATCKRLEVRLASSAAQTDLLYVTLYAVPQPRTAQVKTVQLHAMPLYTRVSALDAAALPGDEAELVLSSLTFTGEFTLEQVQEQLAQTLPDFPPSLRAAGSAAQTVVCYRHAFTGSVLQLTFLHCPPHSSTGLVLTCASDSLSSLAVVRRELTSMAVAHRVRLAIEQDIRAVSAFRTLSQLRPIFDRHRRHARLALLREGLRELQDGSSSNTTNTTTATSTSTSNNNGSDGGGGMGEESIVPAFMQSLFLPEGDTDVSNNTTSAATASMNVPLPASHLSFARHAVEVLLTSLTSFNFYTSAAGQAAAAPALAALDRLVQSEAGVDFDQLVHLFFPHGEHVAERAQLEAAQAQRKKAEQDKAAQDEANSRRRSGTSDSDMPAQAARMVTNGIAVPANDELAL